MTSDDLEKAIQLLCIHKGSILSLLSKEINRMEHLCWKYKSESLYRETVEIKKINNIINHILHDCPKRK